MTDMAKEAIGGLNSLLESHQKAPGDAKLTRVLFDQEYIVAHDGRPIQEVAKLDEHSYRPRGATALLDAIGRTINTVGERLDHTPEKERPGKVLIVILTDGLENASTSSSTATTRKRSTPSRRCGPTTGGFGRSGPSGCSSVIYATVGC
jgi:hypothetical protein